MTIPEHIKQLRQWCCWYYGKDGGKVPTTPSGGVFRSNDPSTFSTYEEAEASGRMIAFVIQDENGLTGVDLDNCIDDRGMLREWAVPIVLRLDGVAYGEISPSGRGIKFLTFAKKLPGSRCKKIMGGDKQQVEVFDFNRFWTITKNVYAGNRSLGRGQDTIDWVCRRYLMDEQPGNLADVDYNAVVDAVELPLEERARKYADSVPTPGEGGRNNAAFSLAGHIFSIVDSGGRSLGFDDVERIVQAWNAMLSDPLTTKEVTAAVRSASKNGTKRETKPPPANVIKPERVQTVSRQLVPQDALRPPGMISDIIDFTLRNSMYPQPELALAGAVALMATITGRKLTDNYGTRTNIYVVGLAPSGSGKEQARKTNKVLLEMAGGSHMIGAERIGSSAGLVTQISSSPSILFQLDEMGRMMTTLKHPAKAPHLYNIATVLMQIYGSSDTIWIGDAYADLKRTPKINQPHPVIYGTSVPAGFWESLTAENITDGLLGRMLPFESAAGYVDPQTPEMSDPPKELVDAVAFWVNLSQGRGNLSDQNPSPVVARYTPAAKERFDSHMMEIAKRRRAEDEQAAALWSRSAGKAGKLALIFAASRQPFCEAPMVDFEDIDRAIKLSNSITRIIQKQVFEHVSANEQEDRTKKVYRLLTKPMTKSQLTRKTQWLGKRERNEIVETLIESGMIEFVTAEPDGGGPPRTIYRRPEV